MIRSDVIARYPTCYPGDNVRLKRALLTTALVSSLALVALPAAAARADSTVPLAFPQLAGFHQILADDAAGYVFISEGTVSDYGPGAGGIVVTDLSGHYVTTLDVGDDAKGLALSPDGKTLYAALAAADAVGVIDAATLRQVTAYPLATAGTAPYNLALQSGRLWVSYDVAASDLAPSHGDIGDFDLSAANPSFEAQPAMDGASAEYFAWSSAPNIAADPADTGVLVAETWAVPLVVTYKVAADSVTKLSWATGETACAPAPASVAVFPGGAQFVMCGTVNLTADLGGLDGSPTEAQGTTLALSPDAQGQNTGLVAIAGYTRGASNAQVSQVANGSWSWPNSFSLPGPEILAAGGLAFGASGSRLYAVLENSAGTAFELQVIDNPAATSSALTLSAPATAAVGNGYTITGGLALSTGSPVAGTPVTVTRSQAGSPAIRYALTTDAHGRFSLTDKPASAGTYTYSAAYAAYGLTAAASTATASVRVGRFTDTAPPAVSGTVKVGSTVTAAPGTWTPAGAAFRYQWLANGAVISGATRPAYVVPPGLAGEKLSVRVTASKAGYQSATATSGAKVIARGTLVMKVRPRLAGTAKVGKALSVTQGAWTPAAAVKVQWYANGRAISRATGLALKLTSSLKGKVISVTVKASRTGYTTSVVTLREAAKIA
jgi:hypothetical protein